MALKNITLTGAEIAVTGLDGSNAAIRNDGADTIYAARQPGITPGADGVLSIPAGGSAVLKCIAGAVYFYGTGAATLDTSDYNDNPFRSAAQGGSGAADEVARAAINEHAGNTEIHVTADDKANWNGKTTITDAAKVFSNPNLLINSDFRINQRGLTEYTEKGKYAIDRWVFYVNGTNNTGSYNAETHELSCSMKNTDGCYVHLYQFIENPIRFAGMKMTFSAQLSDIKNPALIEVWRKENASAKSVATTGYSSKPNQVLTFTMPKDITDETKIQFIIQTRGSIKPEWAKLELGGAATPFVPPDPATELVKCQRYFVRLSSDPNKSINGYNGTGAVFNDTTATINVTLPVVMRALRPTVTMSDVPCEILTPSKGINNTYVPTSIKATSIMVGTCLQIVFSITGGTLGEVAMLSFNRNNGSHIDFDAEIY